jgi:hypothetical protein
MVELPAAGVVSTRAGDYPRREQPFLAWRFKQPGRLLFGDEGGCARECWHPLHIAHEYTRLYANIRRVNG